MTTTEADGGVSAEADLLRSQLAELTDALVATSDQLLALYRVANFSAASLEFTVAATGVVAEAQSILGAESAAFIGLDESGIPGPIASIGDGVTDLLRRVSDLGVCTRPSIERDCDGNGTMLMTPVSARGHHYGAIVASSTATAPFTTGDLKLVGALSSHLAVVLELSLLHRDLVHQAVMQRDHDTASALAQAALNRALPQVPNLTLAAASRPSRAAGGDFFAASRSAAGVFLALGDVSGKGLPAALIMTSAISATYSAFERISDGDTAAVMADIETQLASYLVETGMFITLAVAHIDSTTGSLRITNAGQSPVLVVRRGVVRAVHTSGPPIGVLEPRRHNAEELHLGHGDVLFIGSDGCTDQQGPDDEVFGEDRLGDLLQSSPGSDASDLIGRLFDAIDLFAAGASQADDLTAIAARRSTARPSR